MKGMNFASSSNGTENQKQSKRINEDTKIRCTLVKEWKPLASLPDCHKKIGTAFFQLMLNTWNRFRNARTKRLDTRLGSFCSRVARANRLRNLQATRRTTNRRNRQAVYCEAVPLRDAACFADLRCVGVVSCKAKKTIHKVASPVVLNYSVFPNSS